MDLAYTEKQQAFRAELRQWLAANVPASPLQSFDTAEGFAQHRQWEARLNEGRWAWSPGRWNMAGAAVTWSTG
jgi:hypothetical protein